MNCRRRFSVILLCVIMSILSGCHENSQKPAGLPPAPAHIIIGYSIQNQPIQAVIYGQGDTAVLVLGGIHGNELGGVKLVERLMDELEETPQLSVNKRIIAASRLNPDGIAAHSRFNSNGVDLNRNFPGDNRINDAKKGLYAFSEPESRAIGYLLDRYQPHRIITIHEPLNCVDYDGPGLAIAQAMASVCDLDVKKLGSRPGSLGTYSEMKNIPIITLELPKGSANVPADELWQRYGAALWAGIHAELNN